MHDSTSQRGNSGALVGVGAALAIVFLLVLQAASSGGLFGTETRTTTTTSTVTTPIVVPLSSASSLDSQTGLRLSLDLTANSNRSVTVAVEEFNTLDKVNNVTRGSSWPISQANLSLWYGIDCPTLLPMGYEILQGNYGAGNFTEGAPLFLEAESFIPSCAVYGTGSDTVNFNPASDSAGNNVHVSGTWSGFWTGSTSLGAGNDCPGTNSNKGCPLTLQAFPPGTYTVVAADEWGQSAILHFWVKAG